MGRRNRMLAARSTQRIEGKIVRRRTDAQRMYLDVPRWNRLVPRAGDAWANDRSSALSGESAGFLPKLACCRIVVDAEGQRTQLCPCEILCSEGASRKEEGRGKYISRGEAGSDRSRHWRRIGNREGVSRGLRASRCHGDPAERVRVVETYVAQGDDAGAWLSTAVTQNQRCPAPPCSRSH